MAEKRKVVYIAGPITGVEEYWKPFEKAEEDLTALGYISLSPAKQPQGMTNAQYMRICFAMIDCADAVLILDEGYSEGVRLELHYCLYTGKPIIRQRAVSEDCEGRQPDDIVLAWLKHDLQEVLG